MAAGRAGLEKVFTPDRARQLHSRGDKLRHALQSASDGTLMKVTGYGSILCFHFSKTEVGNITCPQDLVDDDKTLGSIFHLFLLEKGYYIASRGFIALSLALDDAQLEGFVAVVRDFLNDYSTLVGAGSSRAKL
jgi:glutamate-1-semialdehyde 2,1-aminomutase